MLTTKPVETTDNTIRFPRVYRQIHDMVQAQLGLNRAAYSKDWLINGSKKDNNETAWDYPLAASQELGEFLNSWGYAWWSKAPKDMSNCMTELVDAWHFITSQALIEEEGDIARASLSLLAGYAWVADRGTKETSHRDVIRHTKRLMSWLNCYEDCAGFDALPELYAKFFETLLSAGFSLDHFTARYNAKLQLNLFRQLNGYNTKPRTYQKLWKDGQEDNYYLAAFIDDAYGPYLAGIDAKMPTDGEVMRWIAATYSSLTENKSVVPSDTPDTEDDNEEENT